MDSRLLVTRTLPNGLTCPVQPYHVSLKGLESATICREYEDYDVMVKNIFLCARRKNVIVIIYAVVSNHAHVAVLSNAFINVKAFADSLKKVQSMWLRGKYGNSNVLKKKDAYISVIDTMRYARNVLAYIPRNALDNGAKSISEYKWTGYGAMFCNGNGLERFSTDLSGQSHGSSYFYPPRENQNDMLDLSEQHVIAVKDMSTRMVEKHLHTGDKLKDVPWLLNSNMEIIPSSACDWQYLEMIFNHDQAFFMRMIGSVNSSEMAFTISDNAVRMITDEEFVKRVNEYSLSWYKTDLRNLSLQMKIKFLEYLGKKMHLSVAQVARCFQMERKLVARCLGKSLPVRK